MLSLAKTAPNYDACIRMRVLGNALGNSIVDKTTPQTTAGRGKASNNGSWSDDELQEVQVTAKKIDVNPDAIFDVGDIVLPDEWRNIEAKAPTLTVGVTAQSGDSISKILGTSNPKAVEAFMRANNLSGSQIQAGREYVMPSAADYEASDGRIGQAVLNGDNRRLADAAAVPGTFSGDMKLAQANGVSMDDIAAARAYSSSTASSGYASTAAPIEAQGANYGSASWTQGAYLAGPVPAANFDLGPLSLTVNGAFNAVNSVANGILNGVGAITEPFDRYQGVLMSIESGLPGPAGGVAMAGTMALGRLSAGIRAGRAINAGLDVASTAVEGQAMSSGLRSSRVVAPETVMDYLVGSKVGWSESRARDYIGSFEGPITARISRLGEMQLRYFDGPEGSGNFLTRSEFFSPVDAYKGLYLAPARSNTALSRQVVTTQQRSIVFEGSVRSGGKDVQQSLITNKNNFLFGTGYRYW